MDRNDFCYVIHNSRFALEYTRRAGFPAATEARLTNIAKSALTLCWSSEASSETIVACHDRLAHEVEEFMAEAQNPTAARSVLSSVRNVKRDMAENPVRTKEALARIRAELMARSLWWVRPDTTVGQEEVKESAAPPMTEAKKAAPVTEAKKAKVTPAETTTPVKTSGKGQLPPVGSKLTHTRGGKTVEAVVTERGVEFEGKVFGSLSGSALAASHAIGFPVKAVNGRIFWTVQPA